MIWQQMENILTVIYEAKNSDITEIEQQQINLKFEIFEKIDEIVKSFRENTDIK